LSFSAVYAATTVFLRFGSVARFLCSFDRLLGQNSPIYLILS